VNGTQGFIVWALVMWVAPVFVANHVAAGKGRDGGWTWGLLLGWIGVIVCALRRPKNATATPPDWMRTG
jgi:hypothetical protein